MSKSIEDFLIERDYSNQRLKYVFQSGDGEEFSIMYRPLTAKEYGEIQLECRTVDSKGNVAFDNMKFNCSVIAKCCTEPNFNDTGLLERAKCKTPVQFVSTMFSPLEITNFVTIILSCSGVDDEAQKETIDEVKNL